MRELLLAGRRRVRALYIADDVEPSPVLDEIVDLAAEARVAPERIGRRRLATLARTEAPQGVLARAAPLPEADLDDLVDHPGRPGVRGPALLVVLDGVTDPGNLGSLLRSAECAGVTGVVLPRHRSVHVTPTVAKAAAGAIEHLPIAVVGGVPAALARLRSRDVRVVGLDAAAPRSLWDLTALGQGPVALVLGAEGRGLARLVKERCDDLAGLPIRGRLESLNVAVAGAIACYEVVRARS